MLMVINEKVVSPIHANCVVLMRKIWFWLQRDALRSSSERGKMFGGNYGVVCRAVIYEQMPDVCVLIIQVVPCKVECQRDCIPLIYCGSSQIVWVQVHAEVGVDMHHN